MRIALVLDANEAPGSVFGGAGSGVVVLERTLMM